MEQLVCTGELGGGEFEGRGKGRPTKCMLHGGGGVGRTGGGFAEQGEPVHGQQLANASEQKQRRRLAAYASLSNSFTAFLPEWPACAMVSTFDTS